MKHDALRATEALFLSDNAKQEGGHDISDQTCCQLLPARGFQKRNGKHYPDENAETHLLSAWLAFGYYPVTEYLKEWGSDWNKSYVVATSDVRFYEIFNVVYKKYMPFNALQLSTMTHRPGTPWDEARKHGNPIIENNAIKQYFTELAHAGQ